MSLAISILTFLLVLLCLLLGLLILVQLPKKEAGLGQAFGGATTEALFGAGSGNALTQMTKYSAGGFLALCILLAWMNSTYAKSRISGVDQALSAAPATPPALPAMLPAVTNNTPAKLLPTNAPITVPANQ